MKAILHRIKAKIEREFPSPTKRLKKSNWYHSLFPHLREYERLERNADVICLGSTPAKNAIDFKDIEGIQGYNLAVCPETIFYDFQVLKNYHSYLKKGGTILFVLCPFTFLKDFYRDEFGSKSYLNVRYYPILHRAMIDNFDIKLYNKYVLNPLSISWKAKVRSIIDSKPVQQTINQNPETIEQSTARCKDRLSKWMQEFRMNDLNPTRIPEETENAIKGNIRIFKDMKAFIEERGYKAYIIIPPFPSEMVEIIPENLVRHNLLEPIDQIGLPCINYYGHKDWMDRELFYHGFLLNNRGRILLTKDILSKISL